MAPFEFALGDPDYYTPLERTVDTDDPATRFAPTILPDGWKRTEGGIWTQWNPVGNLFPEQGWKVHVAARPERCAAVLDTVAAICAEHGVAFKHLTTERVFLWLHHKHGPRQQSGKFCALYPDGTAAARRLMEALRAALDGERGAFPLTDRRYRDSGVVAYRYGGFRRRTRLRADGSQEHVVLTADGVEVPDLRRPEFTLPEGVVDPFVESDPTRIPGPVSFGGLTFDRVLRHSNGGGAYRAVTSDGTPVFVKEARGHNGYHWAGSSATERLRHEHHVLTELHRIVPGIAPEPLDHFAEWEHDFLVTEFVPGQTLWTWMVQNNPLITVRPDRATVNSYFARCEHWIALLRNQLDRLHAAGYCFGDLNPQNVLVDGDALRLIDFEAAGEISGKRFALGTPGYLPATGGADGLAADKYGLAGIALMLVLPLHPVLEHNPDAAEHLFADAAAVGPIPDPVRARATRHLPFSDRPALPRPAEVAAQPRTHLRALRDATVAGLHAMAAASARHPDNPVFPTSSKGWATNRHCVEHGTAGVLHALRVAGEPIDRDLVERFRRDALGAQDALPPGLLVGAAGIAWVLADLSCIDDARTLLDAADRHPLTATSATLGEGAAGVALTHLALYGHTGDDRHLRRAHELLTRLPAADADLVPLLGPDEATGWRSGRIGIAQALFYAGELCAEPALTRRGLALLRRDLDRAFTDDGGGLMFPVSARDRRGEPYLEVGSAGFALVAGRYRDVHDDERLADAHAAALLSCTIPMSVSAGLWLGTAGLGFALADHAHRGADRTAHEAALRSGRAMYKYAVPAAPGQVRYLSGIDTRFRADLAGGSAGVLIFLARLLDDVSDAAFTLDALLERTRTTTPRAELLPA